jgi:LuxR family maltose regulon positive regulatory protein
MQIAPAYLALARVAFDRGELHDTWLGRLAEVEEHSPEHHVTLAGSLVRAARHEAVGDPDRALAELRGAEARLGGWVPPPPLHEQVLLTRAALLTQIGDLASARVLVDRAVPPRIGTGALLRVRLALDLDEPAAAREALERADDTQPRGRTEARIAGTLLAAGEGDEDRALEFLEDALLAAAPFALRRPFLAGPDLADLLTRRLEHGSAASEFALDLLGRWSPAGAPRAFVDPLTDRERIALRYLTTSLSNAEIAAELYVSVNTVKTHQRAVYRKLGAAGRREAVHRARALGLL